MVSASRQSREIPQWMQRSVHVFALCCVGPSSYQSIAEGELVAYANGNFGHENLKLQIISLSYCCIQASQQGEIMS